jgi:hypothetical protein
MSKLNHNDAGVRYQDRLRPLIIVCWSSAQPTVPGEFSSGRVLAKPAS